MITYKKLVILFSIVIMTLLMVQIFPSQAATDALDNYSFESSFPIVTLSTDCNNVANNWCGYNTNHVWWSNLAAFQGSYSVKLTQTGTIRQYINYDLSSLNGVSFLVFANYASTTVIIQVSFDHSNTVDSQKMWQNQNISDGNWHQFSFYKSEMNTSGKSALTRIQIDSQGSNPIFIDVVQIAVASPPPPCPNYPYCINSPSP